MCKVLVEHKNNKKECEFFVVPGNGQALLGMPDTDVLNTISINIHAIGAEDARDIKHYTYKHTYCPRVQPKTGNIHERISAVQTWTVSQNQQTIT